MRIEDTDRNREVDGSTEDIIKMMRWAGLDWAEGPGSNHGENEGPHGPYYQSQRLDIYDKYAKQLLEVSKNYFTY